MNKNEITDKEIQEQVASEIEESKSFAKTINLEEIQSGEWFIKLLRQVIASYETNGRASYFQQKYPGLSPDEIANILISLASRYAVIAGGITGLTTSVSQIASLASAGMTIGIFVSSIGAEMIYLARLQLRLVLDLSIVYDLQLDPDDPEDILMIFGYALGISPQEAIGKGLQIAAGAGTKTLIKTYVSKGTLQAIQKFASQLGFKILQRTIIQYAVPAVSMLVGGSFNYMSTLSLGNIAKTHLKNRGKVSEELRQLVSRQYTYDIIFPVAIMYIAQIDGEFHGRERQFYKAILSRMSFDEYQQEIFNKLLKHEDNLLAEIGKLGDEIWAETLFELLILMAVYDGKLVDEERQFLTKVAHTLNVDIDIELIESRAEEYRIDYSNEYWNKVTEITGQSLSSAKEASTRFLAYSSDKMKSQWDKLFSKPQNPQNLTEET